MDNLSLYLSMVVAIAAMALFVGGARAGRKRRVAELAATRDALEIFYQLVEELVDDPALPTPAIEVLAATAEIISDREMAGDLVVSIEANWQAPVERSPVTEAMIKLSPSRADLVEKYHRAMASAVIALHLRWPENAQRFYAAITAMASSGRKEAQIASRIAEIKARAPREDDSNGGPVGRMPVPA